MVDMKHGPLPASSEQRRIRTNQIASQLRHHYGDHLLALGVYGSLARGLDGPYSDIEMHCIVKGEHIDTCYEWSTGPWKAEVDVYSPEVILEYAAEVDGDWSITHGQFTNIWVLHDPTSLFPHLETLALSQPQSIFDKVMAEVIIGDIYELVGKVRNAREKANYGSLPLYTIHTAQYAAWLLGLAHRHLFTSSSVLFVESLALPERPVGFDALCQAVMTGALSYPPQNIALVENYWRGVANWAASRSLPIETTLEKLLADEPI